ncbi:MAG: autoinducer binding domain-containing protein [Deltaproteobacteria bacterium]|nr:autoinducer binding domain-containing protein [Deltaproteobacteria bacterium]MCL4873069.1 autoinducer binding domain-containing protein [bacterium]
MPFEDFSKKELISILEIIESAQKCTGADQIKDLILKARGVVEADYAVCGLLGKEKSGAPCISSYINGNYSDEWVNRYMNEGYAANDPIVRHMSKYSLSRLWTEIFKEHRDPASTRLLKDAEDFDLKFGVTGGVFVPELDQVAIFTFAGGKDRFRAHHKRIMDILVLHLQSALVTSIATDAALEKLPDKGMPNWRCKYGL